MRRRDDDEGRRFVPAPRRLTDKPQVSGYKLMVRRIEQGLVSRDVRLFDSPFTKEPRAFAVGLGLGALVLGAALAMSVFSPQGRPDDSPVLATKAGARYVVVDGRVHPVANLSSARLIVGEAVEAKQVSESNLTDQPRGMLMGIAAAPDDMIARTDADSRWVVCSQADRSTALDLTGDDFATQTVVLAGQDALDDDAEHLDAESAVLVTSRIVNPTGTGSQNKLWMLYNGKRFDLTSNASQVRSTLRITEDMADRAVPVSQELIDAIPEQQVFSAPDVAGQGDESEAMEGYSIGAVVSTSGLDDTDYWLVLDSGVQKIGPFTAELLSNSGSDVISDVPAEKVAKVKQVSSVNFDGYPWSVPAISNEQETICFDWERTGSSPSQTSIIASATMPMRDEDKKRVTPFLPSKNMTPQADVFFTNPGKGWLVSATGQTPGSHTAGQVYWVGDNGIRYAIGSDGDKGVAEVLGMLGVGDVTPHLVPWSVLSLLPAGPTLSPAAARTVHATIPPDQAQAPAPEPKALN